MAQSVTDEPYAKRPVPLILGDSANGAVEWAKRFTAWLGTELGNIQRGSARATSRTVTTATTVLATDNVILANATGAPFTVTLPAATGMLDTQVTIKRTNAAGGNVTIGGTVDGTVNPVLAAQWASITVIAIGTNQAAAWYKVASV